MYKASTGIDRSGKTTIVRAFDGAPGVEAIYLTSYHRNDSRWLRTLSDIGESVIGFSTRHHFQALTGAAYLYHLISYFIWRQCQKYLQAVAAMMYSFMKQQMMIGCWNPTLTQKRDPGL